MRPPMPGLTPNRVYKDWSLICFGICFRRNLLQLRRCNLKWNWKWIMKKWQFMKTGFNFVQRPIQKPGRHLRRSVLWSKRSVLDIWQSSEPLYTTIFSLMPGIYRWDKISFFIYLCVAINRLIHRYMSTRIILL